MDIEACSLCGNTLATDLWSVCFLSKNNLLQFKSLEVISSLGKTSLRSIRIAFCLIKPIDITQKKKIENSDKLKKKLTQNSSVG